MLDLGRRRQHLAKNVPACPTCTGKDKNGFLQVQLTGWTSVDRYQRPLPATWKCRMCGLSWTYEPPLGLVVDSSAP